jgi:anti-sigma B factor antagonist
MPDPEVVSNPGLTLSISIADGATSVECQGKLIYENCDFLKREVKSRIPEKGRMVLNLSDVSRMDSSGLGTLVGLYMSARGKNCEFQLINLNKQIRDLLALSNLLSVFETVGRDGIRMH